ncbi:MAG: NepR family anti-sigma factor [Pseudomonadota bacterium]
MTDKHRTTPKGDAGAKQRQDRIGDRLRQLYDEVANEPVPDDFLKLLEEADDAPDDGDEDQTA